jgi:hypothetical protein
VHQAAKSRAVILVMLACPLDDDFVRVSYAPRRTRRTPAQPGTETSLVRPGTNRDMSSASCGSVLASLSYVRSAWRIHACGACGLGSMRHSLLDKSSSVTCPSTSSKDENGRGPSYSALNRAHGEIVALRETFQVSSGLRLMHREYIPGTAFLVETSSCPE